MIAIAGKRGCRSASDLLARDRRSRSRFYIINHYSHLEILYRRVFYIIYDSSTYSLRLVRSLQIVS